MKNILYSDYDGTIVNFLAPWLFDINNKEELTGEKIITPKNMDESKNKEIVKKYYNLVKYGNHYSRVDFLNNEENNDLNGKDFIYSISEELDIVFITSSMSADQKKYKYIHIEEHFRGHYSEIIGARKKFPHTAKGAFLDDNIGHVEKHCEYTNLEDINTKTPGILFNFGGQLSYPKGKIEELKEKYENFYYAETFEEVAVILRDFKNYQVPDIKTKTKKKPSNTMS